ncbi:MAG: respiratory nitrate reductase subunit gamma [Sphingobacteriales bacterium]|jgi:nitrate reductase gamma subunit|nr:respiratory nitrate reductase subunit gamma [Sphingobacteriales bacterium]MBP9142147.1 respiratory nitrate reductase subunit gamma [Chitinophagales bacterium]MDA0199382.1 respiratory nitrate reductase subunit gamma [Bacteroidota bacterium]MBK6891027.1 respiratory nitrate reductase subunit gamma [Sphingobacteriales bacterium]MBK7527143.1 respiratory nitrate reductase subunit gamma [Sphingobacteriales bacterium]
MDGLINALNNFLLIGLPYMALLVFLVGSIYKYTQVKFQYSSLSSQFLEGRQLFWGSVPFHWGILILFFGHLTAFLIPRQVLLWNSHPVRLIVIEVAAFIFAIAVLIGLINLFTRRTTSDRVKMVTSKMDIFIELLLIAQVITGLWVAYNFRWGSSWFASVLTPYLWSIFKLQPDTAAVAALPWVIRLHIAGAYLIVLLIPFSRLTHFLVYPLNYLWRPYQQVMWYWNRKQVRSSDTKWTMQRPKNN